MIKNNWHIEQASLEDVLPIRHQVLWPDDTIESCIVEGDESALHFSVSINSSHVCVASVYKELNGRFRLRKFATLEEFQGQGIGSKMLTFILESLATKEATYLWCDARETALPFYKRFEFQIVGERFSKKGLFYYKIERDLTRKP